MEGRDLVSESMPEEMAGREGITVTFHSWLFLLYFGVAGNGEE